MLVNVYSVFDVKAKSHLQPFFLNNDEMAKRALVHLVNDNEHMFGANASDFMLYRVATFDDVTGQVESVDREHIVDLVQLKESNNG